MIAIAIIGLLLFIVMAAFAIVGALVVFGVVEDEKRIKGQSKDKSNGNN